MDYAASQQIQNIAFDMEPEDALTAALAIIRGLDGVTVRVFTREDVLGFMDEYHDEAGLSDNERSQIANHVTASREWRDLQDASENDWELIKCAIWDGAGTLGIDLNRND